MRIEERAMQGLFTAAAALLMATATVTQAFAEAGDRMAERDIKREIAGKRIYLKVPFGGEFPLYYDKSGVVDGSGQALGLGRFMAPEDRGRWWVDNNRLCQQWEEWYDGKKHCFELVRTGASSLYWKRDDGLEGEARIGQ
jgi:hypothetical protein